MKASSGKCISCSQSLPVNHMARHLQECSQISRQKTTGQLFLIKATARYNPDYWLFIEADCSSALEKLDAILRDIWVECCGHLSCFTIDGEEYHSHPDSTFGERYSSMKVRLDRVLAAGTSFGYKYDFGTTTEIVLKVISRYDGKFEGYTSVLARNDPPELKCTNCGRDATAICSACHFNEGQDDGILCKRCIEEHECGEEMGMSLVNSPRTGMCGYGG